MTRALILCFVAIGCASTNALVSPEQHDPRAPPRAASPASRVAPGGSDEKTEQDCANRCLAYVHFRRGNERYCSCDVDAEDPEMAKAEQEMRDMIVARCGSACPVAERDSKKAATGR